MDNRTMSATPTVEIETKTSILLDIETAARWFANISDDDACKFFVAVAEEVKKWPEHSEYRAQCWFRYIGGHLRTCECSTEEARIMLREIVESMTYQEALEP